MRELKQFHHLGIAVNDVESAISSLKVSFGEAVHEVSPVVFDPLQDARLLMIELGGLRLELVEGKPVESFIKRGQNIYHVCFTVQSLEETIKSLSSGTIMVSPPTPALLFGGKRVAFLYLKSLGLVELLEE